MSVQSPQNVAALPHPLRQKSGVRAALEYTGIPTTWLDKRPRLPSRNWLIFLGVTSTVLGYYTYDRRECRRIREEYKSRVKQFAEQPLHSMDYARKVTVYGAKWPGDDDWDRSTRYFRKYVKPILVAAAVDYEMIAGKRHGDLATRIANDIKSQRRLDLGLDSPAHQITMPVNVKNTPEEKRRRALEGGTVIVGRTTFKEYMAGLQRGWTEPPVIIDREEQVAAELQDDGKFDELDTPASSLNADDADDEPIPTPSRLPSSRSPGVFSPLSMQTRPQEAQLNNQPKSKSDGADMSPPDCIPPQPPLLLVPFVNYLGFKQIPIMIWDFFNERIKVRAGAEAAYCLVMQKTRPFVGPSGSDVIQSDLTFDIGAERWYKSSTNSLPKEIQKARDEYYAALSGKLATARELARHEREPTKEEFATPPPTEVELRAERLKKETRWRGDEAGWEIVKPKSPVDWDSRLEGVLSVFIDPSQATEGGNGQF